MMNTRVIFEGNSLTALDANSVNVGGQYVAQTIYNTIISTKSRVSMISWAVSGRNQTQIATDIGIHITPYAQPGSIISYWEGTNAMGAGGMSAVDAYAQVVSYAQTVIPYGVQLVVGTVAARDMAGDAADLMDRIDAYNALIRSGAATYGWTTADVAADAAFATRAACSNGTNYKADKIHMATAGQNLAASIFATTITPLIP